MTRKRSVTTNYGKAGLNVSVAQAQRLAGRWGRKWSVQLTTHDLEIFTVVHVGSWVDESTAQERVSGGWPCKFYSFFKFI